MGETLRKRLKQERFENPVQEALLNLMVAAAHINERTERVCGKYGLTSQQYNVLRILRGVYPEGYPRCDIIERMIERAPDVTRLIDRLEEQGLAERARDGKDRRLSVTKITKAGLDLLDEMQFGIQELYQYFSERVSLRDRRELSRICEGLYVEQD